MSNRIQFSLLIACIFLSCHSNSTQVQKHEIIKKNDTIDPQTKEQITFMNDHVFYAMKTYDVSAIREFLSPAYLNKNSRELDTILVQGRATLYKGSYRILDAYHITDATPGHAYTVSSGESGLNDYVIKYAPVNPEFYISIFLPNGLDDDFLITAIYEKYGDTWKLNILRFGQYNQFGKSAPEYYARARMFHSQGYLIDALDNLHMADLFLHPAREFWKYQLEDEITAFRDTVTQAVNAQLPFTLGSVESQPQIFGFDVQILDDNFYPAVLYLTSTSISRTAELTREHEKVKSEVNRVYAGINLDKRYVFYRAYNVLPDGSDTVKHYGFIDLGIQ